MRLVNNRSPAMQTPTTAVPTIRKQLDQLRGNVAKVIRGKDEVIEQVVVCLVAGGHLLMEDLPGLGKTTLAYALARSIDCGFSRIQFTSDLLPTDVIGVSVYDDSLREFVFRKGPIFSNIVLADEINRTTPKTQSALLEAMDRGKVSVDGCSYSLEPPFLVFATQNPVDFESTFPLPESQMDRFLMRLEMGYPAPDKELEVLRHGSLRYDSIEIEPVLSGAELVEIQARVQDVFVEESVLEYLLSLVQATRSEAEFRAGASTRAALSLKVAAQARALVRGRGFVLPEDVQEMLVPVLGHRLALLRQATDPLEERRLVKGILRHLLEVIAVPV